MSPSKRLKCSNCNIVISEVLAFIQDKLDVMDEVSLVRICVSAFSNEDIEEAKSLLYESVNKRAKSRKQQGKTQRHLDDIICLFKETDPEKVPIFVAKNLSKLPPVTFDHVDVTALLKKIVLLQSDVEHLKHSSALKSDIVSLETRIHRDLATKEQLNNRFAECKYASILTDSVSNINLNRRGAFLMNSGPMAITTPCSNSSPTENQIMERSINSPFLCKTRAETADPLRAQNHRCNLETAAAAMNVKETDATPRAIDMCRKETTGERIMRCEDSAQSPVANEISTCHRDYSNNNENINVSSPAARKLTFAEMTNNGEKWKEPSRDDRWTVVQQRRFRNRFISKRGNALIENYENVKFKAADTKVPLFISNVHKDVSEKDIIDYIYGKTKEKVSMVKINMKELKDYNAYKIFVTKYKMDIFLDNNLWPEGISFRRFIDFKNKGVN